MKYIKYITILLFIVNFCNAQDSEEVYFNCDCPHTYDSYIENISLSYVRFHGEEYTNRIPMVNDDFSEYPVLDFIHSDENYPVAYVSGTKASVSAAFTSVNCNHPLWIRGETYNNGNDDFIFEDKYILPNQDGDYYYPITEADLEFQGDKVNAFLPFKIHWYISPDRNQWHEIAQSENALYVTHHRPLYGEVDLLHSTIGNSCIAGIFNVYEEDIVPAIYEYFQTLTVQSLLDDGSRHGDLLSYWTDSDQAELCSSTSQLWLEKVGRSENFAKLFEDMIKVQGIDDALVRKATYKNGTAREEMLPHLNWDIMRDMFRIDDLTLPTDPTSIAQCITELLGTHQLGYFLGEADNLTALGEALLDIVIPWLEIPGAPSPSCDPAGDLDDDGFLETTPFMYVKNYSNMTERSFHLDNNSDRDEFTFAWDGAPTIQKLVDDVGLSGQGTYNGGWGNTDPPSIFTELFIVEFDGKYYDPSYGTPSTFTIVEWETNTFQGYGLGIINLPLTIKTQVPMDQTVQYLHWIDSIEGNNDQDVTID